MDPRNPLFWGRVTVRDLHRYQPVCPLSRSPLFSLITNYITSLHLILLITIVFCFCFFFFLQGYRAISQYYGERLSTCLMQLYPDIGLSQSHFDNGLCHLYPFPSHNLFSLSFPVSYKLSISFFIRSRTILENRSREKGILRQVRSLEGNGFSKSCLLASCYSSRSSQLSTSTFLLSIPSLM